MAVKVDLSGHKDLHKVAAAFREAGRRGLARKLDAGTRNAANEVVKEVKASTDTYMPKGFESTFKASLTAAISVRLTTSRTVTVTFTAKGKRAERQLAEFDQGRLRHPVHGRFRRLKDGSRMRNPWVTQRIRPGVVSEPVKRAEPKAVKKIAAKVTELVRELNNIT